MTFEITIKPSDHRFTCAAEDTILAAAMQADLLLPYGCRNGACGTCKGRILSGDVDYGPHQPATLTQDEKRAGLALFCCARPLSNLAIEVREVRRAGQFRQGHADICGPLLRAREHRRRSVGRVVPRFPEASARIGGEPVQVIPAGQAMARLADAIDAGQVPGFDDITQFFEDDVHPNGKGLYFLALVHAATIDGRDPRGLPPLLTRTWQNRDAVISDGLARVLQRLAHDAVREAPVVTAAPVPDAPDLIEEDRLIPARSADVCGLVMTGTRSMERGW